MSKFDDLRRRLEELNRAPLEGGGDAESGAPVEDLRKRIRGKRRSETPDEEKKAPAAIVHRRDLPTVSPAAPAQSLPGEPVDIAAAGGEPFESRGAAALRIVQSVARMEQTWPLLAEAFGKAMATPDSPLRTHLAERLDLADVGPEDMLFMDTETTGLGSSPVFLIGVLGWADGGLVVRQLFARNYAEERAIVSRYLDLAAEKRVLVTFNGKSFDVPYIRARSAANGITFRMDMAHLDLLHLSRRVWGAGLPNCKLQTLETLVCGRRRHGDIPGSAIPDAYHAFVRTGDARQMVEVLRHNMLDLLALVDLLTRLPGRPDGTGDDGC